MRVWLRWWASPSGHPQSGERRRVFSVRRRAYHLEGQGRSVYAWAEVVTVHRSGAMYDRIDRGSVQLERGRSWVT